MSLRETHPSRVEILTRTRGKARAILLLRLLLLLVLLLLLLLMLLLLLLLVLLLLLLTLCEEHAELASLRRILSLDYVLEHLVVDGALRALGERSKLLLSGSACHPSWGKTRRKLLRNTLLRVCMGLRGPQHKKTFLCLLWRHGTLHDFSTQSIYELSIEMCE